MAETAEEKRAAEERRPPEVPELTHREEKKADEQEPPSAGTTHEVIRRKGEKEMLRPNAALAWSGLAAGLAMGFSMAAEGMLTSFLPDAHWAPLISKLGYTAGFLIVILSSQQLFTENTLLPVVPFLVERTREMARNVGRLWAIVLLTNLIGTIIFAVAAAHTDIFEPHVRAAFADIGRKALEDPPGSVFLTAIIAGWLIAAMVWMLPAAGAAKPLIIILMTYLIGLANAGHIIAGSTEVFYLVALREISGMTYLGHFVLPTLAGNILGGITLVALINHAQVVAGGKPS